MGNLYCDFNIQDILLEYYHIIDPFFDDTIFMTGSQIADWFIAADKAAK